MDINVVWELSISDIDCSVFCFPIEAEKEKFRELVRDFIALGKPVSHNWHTPIILKKEDKYNYSFFFIRDLENEEMEDGDDWEDVLCINEKVYNKLYPLLKDEVEFLPMQSDEGMYYVMNVTNTVDCLDREASVCTIAPNGLVIDYEELAFDTGKFKSQYIFRVPELPFTIFVMYSLKKILEIYEEIDFTEDELVFDELANLGL